MSEVKPSTGSVGGLVKALAVSGVVVLLAFFLIFVWQGGLQVRTIMELRTFHGDGWVAVVDSKDGWGVQAHRVRLLRADRLPQPDAEQVVLCPWGAVHVEMMEWAGPAELLVTGHGVPGESLVEGWKGVRVLYELSGR